jgi:N-acetylmuramoyl-L-alanine amidase
MARVLILLGLLLLLPSSVLAQASIDGIRTWAGSGHTRVVFDLSERIDHSVFALSGPSRVVIDFHNARLDPIMLAAAEAQGLVSAMRSAPRERGGLRVVLDLAQPAEVKSFLVRPNDTYGHRLVIDLATQRRPAAEPVRTVAGSGRRELVIAIDAGHGGEDPGAIGPSGTFEKNVVLAVARRLAELVDREPGMRALLIREGDYYIGLRERTRRAREHRADMFISLHADANAHRGVQGASVYTLSRSGASTEAARLLAARENSSDLIGGVSLDDKDDLVATVLLDLSRAATVESSAELANAVLGRLGEIGTIRKRGVEQAGFAVLRSLDMPSVLVELAFISNPQEERRLANAEHQQRMARALMSGIRDYAQSTMLPELRMAEGGRREHVVRRGDTLSGIAQRYQINVSTLRAANNLAGDRIVVGSKLIIP